MWAIATVALGKGFPVWRVKIGWDLKDLKLNLKKYTPLMGDDSQS